MKLKIKSLAVALVCLASLVFISGCSLDRPQYEINDEENYTVSVRYDANGGLFTTNTAVIVDSYDISTLPKNADGMVDIALLPPDAEERETDAFKPTKNGYFFAGWYEKVNEGEDGTVTYSDKWDFDADRVTVDPEGTYSSAEPRITLYAAWVPLFEINFYSADSEEKLTTLKFNPEEKSEFALPVWDEETGAIEMNDIPERAGYTFKAAYLDSELTLPVEGDSIAHPGYIDYETGLSYDSVLDVYVDWTEGEWFRIYTAEQFVENASIAGHYEIMADLDFTEENWPSSFMHNNFEGEIIGNGHTFKNISLTQTNSKKINSGLFGSVSEKATISDVTFEGVTFTVKGGANTMGANFGLFAGILSDDAAISGVTLKNSTVAVDSSAFFAYDDYAISLVCAIGDASGIVTENLTAVAVGENAESITVSCEGNDVTVSAAE